MDNSQILTVVFGLIIITAIAYQIFFNKKAVIKRKLKKAPHKRIYSFRNGEVAKFTGTIEIVDNPLIAPLSKRKCSYYHVIVEKQVSSGKSSHWKTIIEETKSCKYVIRDSSACALIKAYVLKSYVVLDKKFSSGAFNDADANLESYLNKHGHESEGFLGFNKTLRYREGVLEQGEQIAVLGKGKWHDAAEVNLPSNYDRVLVVTASEEHPVYLSDDPSTTKLDRNKRHGRLRR